MDYHHLIIEFSLGVNTYIIILFIRNPPMGSMSGGFDGSLSANVLTDDGKMNFGNYTTNSYVYMGGLPSWYTTKLSSLALPSVVFEPRFRGGIRNVVFADEKSGRPQRQEIMAYKVRPNSVFDHIYNQIQSKNKFF